MTSPFPSSLHEEKGRACGTAMTSPRQNSAGSRALPRTVCGLIDVDCRFHKHRCPPRPPPELHRQQNTVGKGGKSKEEISFGKVSKIHLISLHI